MNFGKISVDKKHLILSLMIGLVVFGIYGRVTMNTQLSPDTNPPMATVVTGFPGAAATDVAEDLAVPMEEAFARLDGVSDVRSTSQDNLSMIQLTFDYTVDVDQAAIDIQNAVSRIREDLPEGIREPQVLKFSTSDMPVMTLALDSGQMDMVELRRLAEDVLVYRLQLVEGVASADLFGGHQQEVLVELDGEKLSGYGLSLQQVAGVLRSRNLDAPGGRVVESGKDLLVRVDHSVDGLMELESVLIPLPGGQGDQVRLGDLGEVRLDSGRREASYRFDGREALALMVTKKADANTVEVVEAVREELERMEKDYPLVEFQVASDDAVFTSQMVNNMSSSVVMAILFTMLVILMFIINGGQSLVVSLSMPLVFLATLGLMKVSGMALDLVTLSALILSIGFVVDAAIVVVENINSKRSEGMDMREAAIEGTAEVAMPSIAGASTTLIVLVPLLFIEGFVGEMFRPLSLTLIYAISASVLVALLMIPLLSVMLSRLKMKRLEGWVLKVARPFNHRMSRLLDSYLSLNRMALAHRKRTFALLGVFLVGSGLFIRANGMEMLPKFDSGVTYVTLEMEPGARVSETEETVARVEEYLAGVPEVESFDARIGYEEGNTQQGDFGIMGADQAMVTVNLSSRKERDRGIWELQTELRQYLDTLPGINRYVVKEKGGTAVTSASAPLALKITGRDPEILAGLAEEVKRGLAGVEGTTNLYTSYNDRYRQLTVRLEEARLQELGLTPREVSSQLYAATEGLDAGTLRVDGGSLLDLRVLETGYTETAREDLLAHPIRNARGVVVPLRALGTVEEVSRTNLVERENLEYTVKVLGFIEGRTFSHVVADARQVVEEMELPRGYAIGFTGEQETLTESMGDMAFLMALAVIFIYLLLVPQFSSFLHPLTILLTIPLIVVGVAPALGLTGKPMSMPVVLGFILLAGTVVNNAILLVDAMNGARKRGATLEKAVEVAVTSRFRPIMMTALSDVVGMLPLAMQLALGSERFSPLAITVIGGILAATFLTLLVIPLLYVSFDEIAVRLRSAREARAER